MTDLLQRKATNKTDERRANMQRAVLHWSRRRDMGIEIVRAIPPDVPAELVGLDLEAHTLHTKTNVIFRVPDRAAVIPLIAALTPQPLYSVQVQRGSRQVSRAEWDIWPVTYEDKHARILRRASLVPFIYEVEQGPTLLRHTVSWVYRVKDDRTIITCDILRDPARFVQITRGKIGERLEARWERTNDFPVGLRHGYWNEWRPYHESVTELLHCRVFWPVHSKAVDPRLIEAPVEVQARNLLEVDK